MIIWEKNRKCGELKKEAEDRKHENGRLWNEHKEDMSEVHGVVKKQHYI